MLSLSYMKRASKHSVQLRGSLYPVVAHEAEEGGYWAECPAFEGCYTQGETLEEVLENISEAIQLCRDELASRKARTAGRGVSLHLVRA